MLDHLSIKNFGRIARLEVPLSGKSVIGLTGPNGSGKSTVLTALELALTGRVEDNFGLYVRNLGSEPAVVELAFTRQGMQGKITRKIAPNGNASHTLVWEDEKITSSKRIDAIMASIWGAGRRAIAEGVFVRQGKLDKMLFGNQAEREELFVQLMGVGHFKMLTSVMDGKIKAMAAGLEDLSTVIDESRATRDRMREDADSRAMEVAQLPDRQGELNDCIRAEQALTQLAACLATFDQTVTTVSKANELMTQFVTQTGSIETLAQERDELQAKLKGLETAQEAYSARLIKARRAQALFANLRTLNEEESQLPSAPTSTEISELLVQVSNWQRLVNEYEHLTRLLDKLLENQRTVDNFPAEAAQIQSLLAEAENRRQSAADGAESLSAELRTLELTHTIVQSLQHGGAHRIEECPVCQNKEFDAKKLLDPAHLAHLAQQLQQKRAQREQFVNAMRAQKGRADGLSSGLQRLTSQRDISAQAIEEIQMQFPDVPGEKLTEHLATLVHNPENAYLQLEKAKLAHQQAVQQERKIATRLAQLQAARNARQEELAGLGFADELEAETSIANAEAELQKMEDPSPLHARLSTLRPLIEEHQRLRREVDRARGAMDQAQASVTRASEVWDAARTAGMLALRSSLTAEDLQASIAELTQTQQHRRQAEGAARMARQALDQQEERLRELVERQRKSENRQLIVTRAKTLRAAMDRQALPLTYTQYRFAELTALAASYLEAMGADFMIKPDPDTSVFLQFKRTNEPEAVWLPQTRLSGGQRVRIAVAFLLAEQRLICPETGLLVLDEPSMHVDADGINDLRDLLEQLTATLENAQAQIVVADHAPELIPAFKQHIRLSASV